MVSMKRWLIHTSFVCTILFICLIYVSINFGRDLRAPTLPKNGLVQHGMHAGLRHKSRPTPEKDDSNMELGYDVGPQAVNASLKTDLAKPHDRKVVKTRNQSPPNQNLQRSSFDHSQTNSDEPSDVSGLTNYSPTTADPLYMYTHRGYVGVLNSKKNLHLHCKRCALVSSSGQLLNSQSGRLIDKADCVFRMNNAPVATYEADVGTRTTLRVVSHIVSTYHREKQLKLIHDSPTKYIVGWGPLKALSKNGDAYKNLRALAKTYNKVEFFHLTQEQMNQSDAIFEAETGRSRAGSGTYLSTGWFTMILVRSSCDEIHVYGMVNDTYCQSSTNKNVPYHYYQPSGVKECDYYRNNERSAKHSHRFITEKSIFARWALEQPPIFFHAPNWGARPHPPPPNPSPKPL